MKSLLVRALLATAGCAAFSARGADSSLPPALTLREAEQTALRQHPQVSIAQLRVLVSQEEVLQNQAAYLPTVDAYADGVAAGNRNTRILAGGINNPVIYDRVADGMSVSELITDFGQTRNRVAGARLSEKAEMENQAATNQQILLNVEANFFRTLQTQAVLKVARDTVAARQTLVDQITALAKNQLRSELDVSFAEVALEQARLLLQQAEGDAEGSQAGLSTALGFRDLRRFTLVDEALPLAPPSAVEDLITTAWSHRPDLLRLSYQRDAALRLARAEKDRDYPTIAAVGTFGNAMSHDYRLPDKYAVGGIDVSVPLFAGGYYVSLQRQADLQARIAGETLRDEEDTVGRDVRLAWLNLQTSIQRLATTEELLLHANQAYALARIRYKVGSSSIVELNDAQVNATSAQIAEANARYDELVQRAILDYQTGTLY
jgi:outer membrane protein